MQDIVFYAAANETLGIVRDYANARNQAAPVLVLGVSVCLRIRLFTACEVATPYPVSAFSGIVDWQWNMDADFDRSTTCKLTADADAISVQTVTDTVNGETLDFTEFVIPISNMNTQELAAWLGNEKKRSGLNGELVGYDNAGNAAFVLQIENFTVRNRVAGLGDPTALDQGIVTRSIAEHMIQSAVSSSASTKQDKLTAANAGTGIAIDSAGTISTSAVPQSAVTGLSASLAAKQDNLTAGYRMAVVSGSTVDQSRWFPIESPSGATVTLMAGHAYKLNATTSSKTLDAETIPADSFGLEGHLEIFVSGTGFVKTGTNVILADALEPDAVNNCTVRFHDGLAIISVEDHVAGYIVVSESGSTAGTLSYALSTAPQEYIAFDASINGRMISISGTTTSADEKHVIGNGYRDTILTGGVSCTGKTTFANLSMQGVTVTGGTMTLGDVYIPSGGTVSVSGGSLAIERVSGGGGTIDLGRTNVSISSTGSGRIADVTGCTITGGSAANGGAMYAYGSAYISGCVFSGNIASNYGGALHLRVKQTMIDCIVTGNAATTGGGVNLLAGTTVYMTGCTITDNTAIVGPDVSIGNNGYLYAQGGCSFGKVILKPESTGNATFVFDGGTNRIDMISSRSYPGTVIISSGTVVDLTGNTNATPINPGRGIEFAPGGATVYPSAGSASAYMLGGLTLPQLGNANTINLNGSDVIVSSGVSAYASGCTFTSGSIILSSGSMTLGTVGVDQVAGDGGTVLIQSGATVILTGNTNATPIDPGGGIVLPVRPESASVHILYMDPDAPLPGEYSSRTFSKLEIHGTTITNLGVVLGATVTIPADTPDTWIIDTTEGTVELTSANAGDYVVGGGLTGIDKS